MPENKKQAIAFTKTLKIIGSKWTIPLLCNLCIGTKRFGELEYALSGISPKTLSLRLQQLERNGIIKKKVFAEVPLHVEYSLTPKGQSLKEIMAHLTKWEEENDC